jgi:phosphoenolpyruvate phosphomutase / 2-hydroxyethylphosphonate cytidylyltransferase
MAFEQRKVLVKNFKVVTKAVELAILDYRPNLRTLKPDYAVHGYDWREDVQKVTRQQVIDSFFEWGAELV